MGLRLSTWRTALIGIVVIKAVLSLAVKPGSFLVSYSGISYFLLLVLATTFAIRNGIQNTLGNRTFWFFLATGYGVWALNQYLQLQFELGLHVAVPKNSIADTLLLLHVVPLMAVVTVLPQRTGAKPKLSGVVLGSFFLLLFWTSLYAYTVFPYQYLQSTSRYGVRFDVLYLAANLGLVLVAGVLTLRREGPWKQVCLHLFAASVLYGISSAVANLAIDTGGYVNGRLYGLCLTASVCWFVWVPLEARQGARAEAATMISDDGGGARPSLWPTIMVVMISIPIFWELLRRNESPGLRNLRLFVAVAITVCLASAAYIKEYLARHESLRESAQRLRLATRAGRMYAYDWDVTTDVVMRSAEHVNILGLREPLRFPHQQFVDRIHPDDRPKFLAAIARLTPENSTSEVTYRTLVSDGTVVWLNSNGQGFFDAERRLLRVIGVVVDVTNVKRAEEALADMTRALIESQEQERSRIGRELHDDINQRLAMLSVELEQLGDSRSEVRSQVQELRRELRQISDDVQAISHDLHSPKMEYLGAVAGMKSWCKEVADRHKIEVAFLSDFSGNLPLNVGIPLFRVLQGAVNNAIKHSGEERIEVQVRGNSSEIHLMVRDSGKGFDVEAALQGKGLGLTSMRERVRLVNGTISIESRPMGGTNIRVRIPLEERRNAERLSA